MFEIEMPEPHASGTGRVAVRPGCWLCVAVHPAADVKAVLESLQIYNPFPHDALWLDVWLDCDPCEAEADGSRVRGVSVTWQASASRPKAALHYSTFAIPPLRATSVEYLLPELTDSGVLFAVRMMPPDAVEVPAGVSYVKRSGTRSVRVPRREGDARDPQPGGGDVPYPPDGSKVIMTEMPADFHRRPANLPAWLQTPAPEVPTPSSATPAPSTPAGVPSADGPVTGVLTAMYVGYRVVEVCNVGTRAEPPEEPAGRPDNPPEELS
jgi:hypothetical protein